MHDRIAHIIPTHERPAVAQRLMDSILWQWPEASVYVCDDSREVHSYEGATVVPAEAYDIGLSAKRNRLVNATEEPYLMLWDDDYVATPDTDLWRFYELLEARPELGIVGGEWLLGGQRQIWFTGRVDAEGPMKRHRPPESPPDRLETEQGLIRYHEVDFVPNWLMARRETLEMVPWDEELKLQEHIEFFCRMAAVRAQHVGADTEAGRRAHQWRERYEARARGETLHEADGGRRLVSCLSTFRNQRELEHLEDGVAHREDWIEVRAGYADELEGKGLARGLTEMEDTRPFPLPENPPPGEDGHAPMGVALVTQTTCIHDRDHQASAAFSENRGRDKFWSLQHQKLGCSETDMVQWGSYPYEEPAFTCTSLGELPSKIRLN